MKKSHIATLLIFLLVIPATLYFGLRLTGRAYYLTSTLVIIEIIIRSCWPLKAADHRRGN